MGEKEGYVKKIMKILQDKAGKVKEITAATFQKIKTCGVFKKIKAPSFDKCKELTFKGGKILFYTIEGRCFLIALLSIAAHYYIAVQKCNFDFKDCVSYDLCEPSYLDILRLNPFRNYNITCFVC